MDPSVGRELIENFEEYLPYLTEYQDVISNTSVFADAIQNFYFNGNLTESNLMTHNVTKVRLRSSNHYPDMRLRLTIYVFPDDRRRYINMAVVSARAIFIGSGQSRCLFLLFHISWDVLVDLRFGQSNVLRYDL